MRQRLNKKNDKNTNDTSKKGRHDEIEKLKEKGIIGGILHLITLIFNFYALISCVSALYDYINGTHKSEDVDLFKTILPQFVAVMVGIVTSPLAMRVVNRTYEDNINLCSDSEQAHKCFSQILKCCFNSIIFLILYQLQYMFTIDELLLSKKNNINNGIGLFNCIIIGFGLFLFLHLYRTFVLGEPYKHQKETSMYNPYQAFITNNKSYSMIVTVSIVCKIIQASIILPICDEMLFRMFFYHRMNIIFLNEGGNGYITYIVGSRHGNLLIALITSLLFNAYNADKKVVENTITDDQIGGTVNNELKYVFDNFTLSCYVRHFLRAHLTHSDIGYERQLELGKSFDLDLLNTIVFSSLKLRISFTL